MIRHLLAALAWLDKRFPPRVTVTKEKMEELESRLFKVARDANGFNADFAALAERVASSEKSVLALKEVIAKAAQPAVIAEARRAAFIGTGRMPD